MKFDTSVIGNVVFPKRGFFLICFAVLLFTSCETEEPTPTYTLSATASPEEGGKVTFSTQTTAYPQGTLVSLTAEPKENWVFKQWEGDINSTSNPLQVTVTSNQAIVAIFVKRDYPLNLKIEGEGIVEEKIITNPSGREYPHGTTVELTPKAKEGWEFESWEGDLIGPETPKRIRVDQQKNVTAKFVKSFMGYKVAAFAKQVGTEYWENTPVLSDLMIGVFQKNFEDFGPPYAYTAWTQAICNGDFNNDGYIDVFNAGSAFGGQKSRLSFLIWNSATKVFEEKNLVNDKTDFIGMPTKVSPIYLNQDDYVDLVIFGHMDESSPTNRIEPITICVSDGAGGYDLTELVLQPVDPNKQVVYEHGSVGDLNGDKLPDLLVMANSLVFVFWGIPTYPYFTNADYVKFQMNESAFYCKIRDVNKDGINDVMIGTNVNNQLFLNDGKGAVFANKVTVPYPTTSTNSMNVFDYIVDDLNLDGLNDFINISATNHKNWSIEVYLQQNDGSFKRETSWIEYTLSMNRTDWRNKLIYFDFDGDGKKDITYSDTGMEPYTSPTSEMKNKTVFIRSGNKFIEKDYFQFDAYAKSLKTKYYK